MPRDGEQVQLVRAGGPCSLVLEGGSRRVRPGDVVNVDEQTAAALLSRGGWHEATPPVTLSSTAAEEE